MTRRESQGTASEPFMYGPPGLWMLEFRPRLRTELCTEADGKTQETSRILTFNASAVAYHAVESLMLDMPGAN